jgi:hypothetical protein
VDTFRTTYRGYYIYLLQKSEGWSLMVAPIAPDLPILARSEFANFDCMETAIAAARNRIDRMMVV